MKLRVWTVTREGDNQPMETTAHTSEAAADREACECIASHVSRDAWKDDPDTGPIVAKWWNLYAEENYAAALTFWYDDAETTPSGYTERNGEMMDSELCLTVESHDLEFENVQPAETFPPATIKEARYTIAGKTYTSPPAEEG